MRKIIFTISALVMFNMAFADNVDFSGAIGETKMPSDAEIMHTLNRFNLTKEERQKVFVATKKRLQEMYANEDVMQANEDLNAGLEALESGVADEFMNERDINALNRDIKKLPGTRKGSVSKY